MRSELDILAPRNLGFALLVAAALYPGALLAAVLGQGVGALLGGCSWIGMTTPLDRQVWALVNQPSMVFSREVAALGYWLGSTILPLLAVGAVGAIQERYRPRRLMLAARLWSSRNLRQSLQVYWMP